MSDPTTENARAADKTPEGEAPVTPAESPEVETPAEDPRIAAAVAAELKTIKDKLDAAYASRDAAVLDLKKQKADAEVEKLTAQGKLVEAAEARERQLNEELTVLRANNVVLTRDNSVRAALAPHAFKNGKAAGFAAAAVTEHLKQNAEGVWLGPDGQTVQQTVAAFVSDEENAFLLSVPTSKGSGAAAPGPTTSNMKSATPLSGMSQAEVLKLVKEGKLR